MANLPQTVYPHAVRGTLASLAASCVFGGIYYYSTLLGPLNGVEIFGWRVLVTLPCLTIFMLGGRYWPLVSEVWARVRRQVAILPLLLLSSALIGVQFWLFMWAPINGKALEVSLGYLLMPLVMVVCGRFFYKERLQPFQKAAVVCATIGVANQVYRLGGISWEVLVVALGFPCYFMLRRTLKTDHLGGLWFDFCLMIPAAIWIVDGSPHAWGVLGETPRLYWQIPLLGVLSAAGVAGFIVASRLLPLGVFGLLSYMEPVLLVVVSLLLGARIQPDERLTYAGVWLAVAILIWGGVRNTLRNQRRPVGRP